MCRTLIAAALVVSMLVPLSQQSRPDQPCESLCNLTPTEWAIDVLTDPYQ